MKIFGLEKVHHISFVVGSEFGPRSSKWVISIDKAEVYVTSYKCRKMWKVSLHKSGQWHLKSINKKFHQKVILKSYQRDVPVDKYPVGLHIGIPDSSLRRSSDPTKSSLPDHWLDRPEYDGFLEISLIITDFSDGREEWPGKAAGTVPKFFYRINEDDVLLVLVRYLGPENQLTKDIEAKIRSAIADTKPITLDSPERRGYIFGKNEIGSIVITEYAID